MMEWLTGTTAGKFIWAFLISMVPVVELRGGLPIAISSGLPWPLAYLATILGNMLPVPFIIIFIKKIFAWLRKHWPWMDRIVTKLEKRAESKSDTVERYGPWGLLLFVAIPAPGTGAGGCRRAVRPAAAPPQAGRGTGDPGGCLHCRPDYDRSDIRSNSSLLNEVCYDISVLDSCSCGRLSSWITELFDHYFLPFPRKRHSQARQRKCRRYEYDPGIRLGGWRRDACL